MPEKERAALFFGEPRQASPLCRRAASDATALPKACDSAGIRTRDPQLRRLLLYPAELPNPTALAVLRHRLQQCLYQRLDARLGRVTYAAVNQLAVLEE